MARQRREEEETPEETPEETKKPVKKISCKLFGQFEPTDDDCKICAAAKECEEKTEELAKSLKADLSPEEPEEDKPEPEEEESEEMTEESEETQEESSEEEPEPTEPEDPPEPKKKSAPRKVKATGPALTSGEKKSITLPGVSFELNMDDVRALKRIVDLGTLCCIMLSNALDLDKDE
jgi:hypothetical protein